MAEQQQVELSEKDLKEYLRELKDWTFYISEIERVIIPGLREQNQKRKHEEEKRIAHMDKLSDEQKEKLAEYTLVTKDRENWIRWLTSMIAMSKFMNGVLHLYAEYNTELFNWQNEIKDLKNSRLNGKEVVENLQEFIEVCQNIQTFDSEGFKVPTKKMDLILFKTAIDKVWNCLTTQSGGQSL